MVKEVEHIVYYLELTFKEKKMKKFLIGFLLISGLMSQGLPEPSIVGEGNLKRPTLRISEFVSVSDKVVVEDERITFGIRQLLQESFSDTRYILTDDNNQLTSKQVKKAIEDSALNNSYISLFDEKRNIKLLYVCRYCLVVAFQWI